MVARDLAYHVIGLNTQCLWVTPTPIPGLHFLSERRHNVTSHPLGIFRHHWLLMFTFLFTLKAHGEILRAGLKIGYEVGFEFSLEDFLKCFFKMFFFLMSGSFHLDKALNFEIDGECSFTFLFTP